MHFPFVVVCFAITYCIFSLVSLHSYSTFIRQSLSITVLFIIIRYTLPSITIAINSYVTLPRSTCSPFSFIILAEFTILPAYYYLLYDLSIIATSSSTTIIHFPVTLYTQSSSSSSPSISPHICSPIPTITAITAVFPLPKPFI